MQSNKNSLPSGHVLNNKYIVEAILGEGSFGITYKVRDRYLTNRLYAIKEYLPSNYASRDNHSTSVVLNTQKDKEFFNWGLESFMNEAKTLASFNHPNIAKIIEYFEANSTAYFVMPFEEDKHLMKS